MNILITGHKGFIGRELLKRLEVKNSVVGLDLKDGNDLLDCVFPSDIDLVIHKESYTFKPTTSIDPKATELHGLDDEFFKSNSKLYKRFLKKDANEINEILRGMK